MRWILVALAGLLALATSAGALTGRSEPARESTGTARCTPGTAAIYTTTLTIPTYPYTPCLEQRANGPYPYHWLDWGCYGNPAPLNRDYELLALENDYLRVTLLPELGGRVYQMVYKPTGHNELYQNPVIKPTHWGPAEQGWWLAVGGLEWCLPVDEHGYEWGEPWTCQVVTSTAGVTVTLRDTSATDRLRAAIAVHLPADKGYLAITPRLENPTGGELGYKYWTNAMLAPGPANTVSADLRFVFTASEMAVHSTGDSRLPGAWPTQPTGPDYRFSWPVYNGVDFSRLGHWDEWLGFFEYPQAGADFVCAPRRSARPRPDWVTAEKRGSQTRFEQLFPSTEYPQAGADFIGVYDTAVDEGVARVFPASVARGAKGFGFGWGSPIDPRTWTDDGSAYVELHGGVAPTFWDQATLLAGQSLEWTEYWYPVNGIGGLSAATAEAALSVREAGGSFHIGVHSTAFRPAGASTLYVWDRLTCVELARLELPAIAPGLPFTASVATGGRAAADVAFVYVAADGSLLAAVNPADCLPPVSTVEPLPPWVDTTTFTVTWTGHDTWTGIAAYDVQARDGYEGLWTDWLTGTAATAGAFSGSPGHTYFFRVRARDQAGHQEAFGDEEWGQAFTTVLTGPAPVLVTSRKFAAPRRFRPDQTIAYTVVISNTGNLTATAVLTDTLPAGLLLLPETLTATAGSPPTCQAGQIRWSGPVEAGGEVRVTYTLSPTAGLAGPLTNTAEIAGGVLGPVTRRETVVQACRLWLPLVMRK